MGLQGLVAGSSGIVRPYLYRASAAIIVTVMAAAAVAAEQAPAARPPPHMNENLVHPPVLRYQAISRNLRLFWDALGVVCA